MRHVVSVTRPSEQLTARRPSPRGTWPPTGPYAQSYWLAAFDDIVSGVSPLLPDACRETTIHSQIGHDGRGYAARFFRGASRSRPGIRT